jgi:hypothetical protein
LDWRPQSMLALAADEACILCYPSAENGALPEIEDCADRRVLDLIVTAYLLSDPRPAKAVMTVLDRAGLTGGPNYIDGFGNRHYILQWHGERPIYARHRTRLCFDSDDHCVILRQAIEPKYVPALTRIGAFVEVPDEPIGTYTIPVCGDWKQGHILDTPHRKLPELLQPDAMRLIEDCELARWGARPLAKEAAA